MNKNVDTSNYATIDKSIDSKQRKAISSKTKDIKVKVVCINKPSQQSLSNFAVKYQEIFNKRGMGNE